MRRSASEVIRSLESRVARLERQAKNQDWKKSVKSMVSYFEREVGKSFNGTDFEIDPRIPSDTRSLKQEHQNTATLAFILNGNAVYLDAYEQYNMFGKAMFSFNLMSEDGRKILHSVQKSPMPLSQEMVPKIIEMLEPFRPKAVDYTGVLKDLYRALQEDYIDANNVADLLRQLFDGKDLKEAFNYAKGTQAKDEIESALGAKALWDNFIVPRMRDEVGTARLPNKF